MRGLQNESYQVTTANHHPHAIRTKLMTFESESDSKSALQVYSTSHMTSSTKKIQKNFPHRLLLPLSMFIDWKYIETLFTW